jgi:putative ABC transport system permease protein
LFGLAAYTAERRTKEIGIRKVLGSSVCSIVILLSKEFTKWVLLANVIAWPVSYYIMNKWLEGFAYRTELNLWIFFLSGGGALLISILTVIYQAVKAAVANPVESLRNE